MANHYIRAGASGTGSGNNWTDAYPAFLSSSSYVRGDTYYVAAGAYANASFSTPANGTQTITIKKATVADHGISTGWLDSYGTGQATWTSNGSCLSISTAWWIIDGVTGDGSQTVSGSDESTYGFRLNAPNNSTDSTMLKVGDFSDTADDCVIKHVSMRCQGGGHDGTSMFGAHSWGQRTTYSQCYANDCQVSFWTQRTGIIIDKCYLGTFWGNNPHGVHIEITDDCIISNCIFADGSNQQMIEPGGGPTTDINRAKIFNNVFVNCTSPNGVIKGTAQGAVNNSEIYNNTCINITGPLLFQSNTDAASGNIVRNNVLYNCGDFLDTGGGSAITHSHNTFNSSAGSEAETGLEIRSGNPFVNYPAGNYALTSETAAGLTLAAQFSTDLYGVARGAGGVWTRGAVEFGGSDTTPPAAPTNLRFQ